MDIKNILNELTTESKELYKALVNEATLNAIKYMKKQEKNKVDNRLNNTSLLLKNYNKFKEHVNNATYADKDLSVEELEEIDNCTWDDGESNIIQAILKTKKRTKIMIDHVDKCLKLYKLNCEMSGREDIARRYNVINYLFIELKEDGLNYTTEEIAERLYVSTGTVSSTKNIAIKELSILLFGIDALKID